MIELSHVTKRFGATLALDDVSFAVRPGSIVGFLGPNGAGKSTALRCLVGSSSRTPAPQPWPGSPTAPCAAPGWWRVCS